MPFTPFHFGPAAIVHAAAPRQVSFLAFCAANVFIDVEPLYYMITSQYPLHRFFHTYAGATLIVIMTILFFVVAKSLSFAISLPNPFSWQGTTFLQIVIGAILGSYSHVLLDSFMHADIRPFAPFSDANPLLDAISFGSLHGLCIASGIVGMFILDIRKGSARSGR